MLTLASLLALDAVDRADRANIMAMWHIEEVVIIQRTLEAGFET